MSAAREQKLRATIALIDKLLAMYNTQIHRLILLRRALRGEAFKKGYGHKIPNYPGL